MHILALHRRNPLWLLFCQRVKSLFDVPSLFLVSIRLTPHRPDLWCQSTTVQTLMSPNTYDSHQFYNLVAELVTEAGESESGTT